MRTERKLFRAAMVVDGEDVKAAPGAVLTAGAQILAAGTPEAIGQPADARVVDLPDAVIMPALVNAHAHLDLTHVGPMPPGGDFVTWIEDVRARRADTAGGIADSVRSGVELARAGGTAIVGDIAGVGSDVAVRSLREAGLAGVSYLEFFGLGSRQRGASERMRQVVQAIPAVEGGVRLGLQPHAPYSCGMEVYRAAAEFGLPLSTHLAETPGELELLDAGTGPLRAMLERFGVWEPGIEPPGCHPVDHLQSLLATTPVVAAHLNYLEDRHIERLARWPVTVAYCPRASAYFGHPEAGHAAHRYREVIEAGGRVALGTDSIVCLDTPGRISVLDEMRLLYRRDGMDPEILLAMATVAGAEALGFDAALVTLQPGCTAGLLAVSSGSSAAPDALRRVLLGDAAPRWIVGPVPGVELLP